MKFGEILGLGLAFLAAVLAGRGAAGAEPASAMVGADGRIHVSRGRTAVVSLGAGLYNPQWASAEAVADAKDAAESPRRALRLGVPGGGVIKGTAAVAAEGGLLSAEYVFTPEQDVALNSLHVHADFPIAALAGGSWKTDSKNGTFPRDFGEMILASGPTKSLALEFPSGEKLEFSFPEPTPVLLQDNRKWGPSFVLRIIRASEKGQPFRKGVPVKLAFKLAAPGGITVEHDAPVTITAGPDWIPLDLALDIEPGSALDFSKLTGLDAPAGKHGWLQAREDGTFRFEKLPERPQRFCGVNFCFSALFITRDQADRLAERLSRLGYNTVRVHHYEAELTEKADRTKLSPDKAEQLDYLLAAFLKRGLYVTTDLFVSRPADVERFCPGVEAVRRDRMNAYKLLVPVNEAAWEDWKAFSRNFLAHVNPHTGRAYKDEPGLAWLSLINEGNLGNYVGLMKEIPDYRKAWNRWLAAEYRDRAGLAAAWGAVLKEGEDPAAGSVALDGNFYDQDARGRDLVRFLSRVEADFVARATKFLREELGCRALLTNANGWTNPATLQGARAAMDYVDDHFYVDHPHFLEQPWRLPSRCGNTSPVAGGASGGRHVAFTRLLDRPWTLSEYNYSAPGRYRGVGGILTGSMGAIQDWGVIWRFAYSHNRDNLMKPGKLNYFDMAADPLGQAAERASLCLFLRGDMKRAPHALSIAMTPEDLARPPAKVPMVAPGWSWAAWVARVGTRVVKDPAAPLADELVLPLGWATPASAYAKAKTAADAGDPYKLSGDRLAGLLRERGILRDGNPTDPAKNVFQSETGELTIDGPRDTMTLDTPRTAGGFAPAGAKIVTRSGVEVAVQDVEATVWASALDDAPIATSRRLLVTHLTDLQNTRIRYAERARQTLLDWGELPHLVRAGKAEVRLKLKEPGKFKVWALATSGKRLVEVPARVDGEHLVFTADVACARDRSAVMCYEVAE
ncbi:MAG TPA: hypothetical protein PK280_14640 [Planctomycetota bacterium]|nr:hypothetical protein [Planctomycetota bacterium]